MAKIGKTGRHTQARKAERQSRARHKRNRDRLSSLVSFSHKVLQAVAKKDKAGAQKALSEAFCQYDKAASKGILHPNSAARHKARLSLKVRALAT